MLAFTIITITIIFSIILYNKTKQKEQKEFEAKQEEKRKQQELKSKQEEERKQKEL